jgi:hypothetical protein
MKGFFKGLKLAFCIYQIFYGIAAIIKHEYIHPVTFTLIAVILLLEVIIDILEVVIHDRFH